MLSRGKLIEMFSDGDVADVTGNQWIMVPLQWFIVSVMVVLHGSGSNGGLTTGVVANRPSRACPLVPDLVKDEAAGVRQRKAFKP